MMVKATGTATGLPVAARPVEASVPVKVAVLTQGPKPATVAVSVPDKLVEAWAASPLPLAGLIAMLPGTVEPQFRAFEPALALLVTLPVSELVVPPRRVVGPLMPSAAAIAAAPGVLPVLDEVNDEVQSSATG